MSDDCLKYYGSVRCLTAHTGLEIQDDDVRTKSRGKDVLYAENSQNLSSSECLRKILSSVQDLNAVTADNAAKVTMANQSVEKLNNAIDDAVQRLKVAKPNKNTRPAFDEDEMVPVSSFREDEIAFQAYRKFCNEVEGLKEEGAQVLKQVLGCK